LKVVILAGGLGTRISEETGDKPKPMVLIGNQPMLWHIMNIYASQGFKEFIVAAGYRSETILDWALNLKSDWLITTVDTGLETQTGGRIKRCMHLFPGETILATYGDGLGNVKISSLIEFHQSHGKLATLTAVRPPARFGYLDVTEGKVLSFGEKNQTSAGWINGGFFVFEPEVANYICSDGEPLETGALPRLVEENELMAFNHEGFWQPMDTLREKNDLSLLLKDVPPPWLR